MTTSNTTLANKVRQKILPPFKKNAIPAQYQVKVSEVPLTIWTKISSNGSCVWDLCDPSSLSVQPLPLPCPHSRTLPHTTLLRLPSLTLPPFALGDYRHPSTTPSSNHRTPTRPPWGDAPIASPTQSPSPIAPPGRLLGRYHCHVVS